MAFFQDPPRLDNQYDDDRVLRGYLARVLPDDMRRAVEPELRDMGALSGGELFALQAEDRSHEPRLVLGVAGVIVQVFITAKGKKKRR